MTEISMKHLRYFDALARWGHFGRAADACAITQPALSLQIKELEEILGTPLVERGARQIRLTGFGELFAERSRDILRAVEDLGALARTAGSPFAGRLRLGVIPTVAPYLLPAVIRDLSARHPDLDLRPREAVTRKLVDDLLDGRLDAAIVALPISEPSLHVEALFDEEFLLVRPAMDAAEPTPDAEMLRTMRLLLLEEGHCFRDQAISFCKITPSRSSDLIEGSSLATLVQMVGAGIGVTLIPEMAVPVEARSDAVSVVRLSGARPSRTIGMVWRKSSPLAGAFSTIAALVGRIGIGDRQGDARC